MNKMNNEWDFTEVDNSDEVCWQKDDETAEYSLRPITESLLRTTALTGVSHLTDTTLGILLRRVKILVAAGIPLELFDFTYEDAQAHMGMKTIAKQLDEKAFKNQVYSSLVEVSSHIETKFDKPAPEIPAPTTNNLVDLNGEPVT